MKKNILQPEVKEEIISRLNMLTPESKREWGKMNVNQMLRHTADGLRIAYGDIIPEGKPTTGIKRALMRFVILHTDIPAPKGKAITMPELNMVERNIDPTDFAAEKQELINMVKTFPSKSIYHTSQLIGPMKKEDWARLNYGHIDHHLRQFGV